MPEIECPTLVAFEPLQLGEDVNQRSALFRSTIPLGSNPCARKNRLQYGSGASELELRFGRGPRLPKYIPASDCANIRVSTAMYCSPVLRHSAGLIQAANFRSAVVF
jgi:hypothetical protein